MTRSFDQWFKNQGKTEPKPQEEEGGYLNSEVLWFECSCGRWETFTEAAYDNGDTGWYIEDIESGKGMCGGPYCRP